MNFIFQLLLYIPRTSFFIGYGHLLLFYLTLVSYSQDTKYILFWSLFSSLNNSFNLFILLWGVFSVVVVFFRYLVIPVYLGIFVNERLGLLVTSSVYFYNLCVSPVLTTSQTPWKKLCMVVFHCTPESTSWNVRGNQIGPFFLSTILTLFL